MEKLAFQIPCFISDINIFVTVHSDHAQLSRSPLSPLLTPTHAPLLSYPSTPPYSFIFLAPFKAVTAPMHSVT